MFIVRKSIFLNAQGVVIPLTTSADTLKEFWRHWRKAKHLPFSHLHYAVETSTSSVWRYKGTIYLYFVETLPSWSPLGRRIMNAASTNHMIRFGPLTFRPVKGKNQLLLQFISFYILHSNFEIETGHVVTSCDISFNQKIEWFSWPKCSHPFLSAEKRPPKRSKKTPTLDSS